MIILSPALLRTHCTVPSPINPTIPATHRGCQHRRQWPLPRSQPSARQLPTPAQDPRPAPSEGRRLATPPPQMGCGVEGIRKCPNASWPPFPESPGASHPITTFPGASKPPFPSVQWGTPHFHPSQSPLGLQPHSGHPPPPPPHTFPACPGPQPPFPACSRVGQGRMWWRSTHLWGTGCPPHVMVML